MATHKSYRARAAESFSSGVESPLEALGTRALREAQAELQRKAAEMEMDSDRDPAALEMLEEALAHEPRDAHERRAAARAYLGVTRSKGATRVEMKARDDQLDDSDQGALEPLLQEVIRMAGSGVRKEVEDLAFDASIAFDAGDIRATNRALEDIADAIDGTEVDEWLQRAYEVVSAAKKSASDVDTKDNERDVWTSWVDVGFPIADKMMRAGIAERVESGRITEDEAQELLDLLDAIRDNSSNDKIEPDYYEDLVADMRELGDRVATMDWGNSFPYENWHRDADEIEKYGDGLRDWYGDDWKGASDVETKGAEQELRDWFFDVEERVAEMAKDPAVPVENVEALAQFLTDMRNAEVESLEAMVDVYEDGSTGVLPKDLYGIREIIDRVDDERNAKSATRVEIKREAEGDACWVEIKFGEANGDFDPDVAYDDMNEMLGQFRGTAADEMGDNETFYADFDTQDDAEAFIAAARSKYGRDIYVDAFDKETEENLGWKSAGAVETKYSADAPYLEEWPAFVAAWDKFMNSEIDGEPLFKVHWDHRDAVGGVLESYTRFSNLVNNSRGKRDYVEIANGAQELIDELDNIDTELELDGIPDLVASLEGITVECDDQVASTKGVDTKGDMGFHGSVKLERGTDLGGTALEDIAAEHNASGGVYEDGRWFKWDFPSLEDAQAFADEAINEDGVEDATFGDVDS